MKFFSTQIGEIVTGIKILDTIAATTSRTIIVTLEGRGSVIDTGTIQVRTARHFKVFGFLLGQGEGIVKGLGIVGHGAGRWK